MITYPLRKVGNSYVITVPKSEVERLGAKEGDQLAAEYTLVEMKPVLSKELQDNIDRNRDGLSAVMRYLKDK